MRIAFHNLNLTYRGTTTAIRDYARYNQNILGNESVIIYNQNHMMYDDEDRNKPQIIDDLKRDIELITYNSFEDDVNRICEDNSFDAIYFLKHGTIDYQITTNTKNLIHTVFQSNEPHGDRYSFVSSWLANTMTGNPNNYVPHIVDLPQNPVYPLRERIGIPKDKIVLGRYGGKFEFNLSFVYSAIEQILAQDDRYVFLFVNTHKFIDHPNCIFLDPIYSQQDKTDFIHACDAMFHGRFQGETFGLSICEFLFHNKPVLAWNWGIDMNHVDLLSSTQTLYTPENIIEKLLSLRDPEIYKFDYRSLVAPFQPKPVMDQFNKIFLT